jgi:hypothetical protein
MKYPEENAKYVEEGESPAAAETTFCNWETRRLCWRHNPVARELELRQ